MFLDLLWKNKEITTKTLLKRIFFQLLICIIISFIATIYLRNKIYINNSPSVPVGFYLKKEQDIYFKDNIVFFKVPDNVGRFLKELNLIKEENKYILKKIGGVEGDHIVIKDKKLYINDVFIYEVIEHTFHKIPLNPIENLDYILKEDEYFLIGDLKESYDSRYFGVVKKEQIEGKGKLLLSTYKERKADEK
ncbi:signal peptidase I [Fusobacterium necrophorum]|uniref:signal peptidase I n=1 Tax=Fusobacterium necrophorum TaxID=859 RepID=UPI0008865F50|nr:signal peptidase I [Fusobacterium necrophorum]SDB16709.1 signal peptidase I [Fusobacterium necrophorum]SQC98558.1 conjugal transfer peptidase TraF [Fusobacterium necrophorum subsp. necrophorum]